MTVARTATEALADHLTLEVESIDRLYLNVYQSTLQASAGSARFFREVRGMPVPSSALMVPMTQAFVASVEAFARDHGIDLISFQHAERKNDHTQERPRQWPDDEDVLHIGKAQVGVRVIRTQVVVDPITGSRQTEFANSVALPNAYYFYAFGNDVGPFLLKFRSYFPFTAQARQADLGYLLSVRKAEFSLTEVFDRPQQGWVLFKELVREKLESGWPDRVQMVFERRVNRRMPGRFCSRVLTSGVRPSLYFEYKKKRVEQYFKEGRSWCGETTINDTYDFGIGRKLGNIESLQTIGFTANPYPLPVSRLCHDSAPEARHLAELHAPGEVGGQRAPVPCFGDAQAKAQLGVALALVFQLEDFRQREVRERMVGLLGHTAEEWSSGLMTYDLRRLRLRASATRRYRLTKMVLHTAMCYYRTHARVLRQALATVAASGAASTTPLRKLLAGFGYEVGYLR